MEETKKEPPLPNNPTNIKKKREDKQRRRDHRAIENIMKELINMDDSEKLKVLLKKYSELYDEFRIHQNNAALNEKRLTVLQRERDQLQTEQGKLVLAKARMESLCRELQKQNKLIKEENLAKIREEEEKRKEVALKFQTTLSEVSSMVQENSEKNIKLRDDNMDMANKIQALCEQFDKRKEQLMRVEKQLELERQLSDATIAKAELELKAEREMWTKERDALQANLQKSEENCKKLQDTIIVLEENLKMYSGKYKEFESTITKSNEVFDNCKSEMYKMTKQIAALEKECKTFKQRWQKNAQCVIELTATKQAQDTKIDSLERKLEQLQKLCRQLQADRSSYIKLLKANNIEPVSQKCEEPEVSPRKTKKELELEQLKDKLKVLQEHFNSMTASTSGDNSESTENPCQCEPSSQQVPSTLNEPKKLESDQEVVGTCTLQESISNLDQHSVNPTEETPTDLTEAHFTQELVNDTKKTLLRTEEPLNLSKESATCTNELNTASEATNLLDKEEPIDFTSTLNSDGSVNSTKEQIDSTENILEELIPDKEEPINCTLSPNTDDSVNSTKGQIDSTEHLSEIINFTEEPSQSTRKFENPEETTGSAQDFTNPTEELANLAEKLSTLTKKLVVTSVPESVATKLENQSEDVSDATEEEVKVNHAAGDSLMLEGCVNSKVLLETDNVSDMKPLNNGQEATKTS